VEVKDEIRLLRKAFRETQEQFAKRFDVKQHTISQWERGKRKVKGPALKKLEEILEEALRN